MASVGELAKLAPAFRASERAPKDFHFEKVKGRPFRIISIETEVDGTASTLAETLFTCGLVPKTTVMPYGWRPVVQHSYPGFLKRDGSVSGGELVMELLDLTKKEHAEGLQFVVDRLRVLERDRKIAYNANCGGHIHIDADGYGLFDVWRGNELFGYLEDPIYRLAGAGKTYGHRSLFPGYDRANHGGGYANPVAKGPFGSYMDCFGRLQRMDRMSGLNYTLYFHGKGCRCKKSVAMEDGYMLDYKACECAKSQHTIEWRVWNSQGNPRILYSWIALMQAMMAWSWRPNTEKSVYETVEHLPPLGFTKKAHDASAKAVVKESKERVEWMFSELPLTAEEKDALAYAFMRSEYKSWGAAFFKGVVNTPTKAPPYPNEYKPAKHLHRDVKAVVPKGVPKEDKSPFDIDEGDGDIDDMPPVPEDPQALDMNWIPNDPINIRFEPARAAVIQPERLANPEAERAFQDLMNNVRARERANQERGR